MNYEQARAYAVNVSRSGSILGLDSIENLMHELGDIQELSLIHICRAKRQRYRNGIPELRIISTYDRI